MFRELPKLQEFYIVDADGGIGDLIARLPALNWTLNRYQNLKITYWTKSFSKLIVQRSIPKNDRLIVKTFDEKNEAKKGIPLKKFDGNVYTNLASHMTQHAFDIIANTRPEDPNHYNYLPISTKGVYLPKVLKKVKKYVVVPTGYTAKVREFRPEVVNKIVEYINSKGYTPVFLGKTETPETSDKSKVIRGNFSEEIDYSKGINLINKTDILQTVKIIQNAKAIVGLDNGLLHLAGTTDIPIIGGFTTVKPWHRLPYRNGEMGWNYYPVHLNEDELVCNFCQSNMTFTINHDFRKCLYDDYKCCKMLTADRYIEQLERVL